MKAWWIGLVSGVFALQTLATPSQAADPTAEALRALRVRDIVRVRFSTEEGWQFALDNDVVFRKLDSAANLSATRPLVLAYSDFNPLVIDLSVAEAVTSTAGAKQLEDFLGKLASFPATLTAVHAPSGMVADTGDGSFEGKLRMLVRLVDNPVVTQQAVRDWVADATGRSGVVEVARRISNEAEALEKNAANIAIVYSELLALADAGRDAPSGQAPGAASPEQVAIPGQMLRLLRIDTRIAGKHALSKQLTDLAKRLRQVAKPSSWIGESDYRFGEIAPQEGKIVTASITAVTHAYSLEAGELSIGATSHRKKLAALGVRQHSRMIPEVAAGLVVASVRRPQYGTAELDGETVVARLDDETVDFSAALLLNGVCDCFGSGSFVQPMLQFGIAGGPETPSLLAGFGFRFTRVKRLALSGGAVVAWIRDLETLSPGDPVDGTAAIQDDMGLKATVKGYFALQYTF